MGVLKLKGSFYALMGLAILIFTASAPPYTSVAEAKTRSKVKVAQLSERACSALSAQTKRTLTQATRQPTLPPFLLPEHKELLRSATLTLGPTWHATSMRERDFSVYIHASAQAINLPEVKRPPVRVPSLSVPRIRRRERAKLQSCNSEPICHSKILKLKNPK